MIGKPYQSRNVETAYPPIQRLPDFFHGGKADVA